MPDTETRDLFSRNSQNFSKVVIMLGNLCTKSFKNNNIFLERGIKSLTNNF